MNYKKLFLYDRCTYVLMLPFFIWSFLGGWRQQIGGIVSDHGATVLALVACALILTRRHALFESHRVVIFLYICILFLSAFSMTMVDGNHGFYVFFQGLIYFFISISLSIFFREMPRLFFETVIFSALFSSVIILISWYFLGMGEWGRMTVPFIKDGYYGYFSSEYGNFTDPNLLAYYLSFGIFSVLFHRRNRAWRWVACGSMGLALILTMSRSAAVGIVFVFLFLGLRFNDVINGRRLLFWVGGFLGLVFFLDMYSGGYFHTIVVDRINDPSSNTSRMVGLDLAINLILDSDLQILFGRGVGYSTSTADPHNFYLSSVLDTGLFSVVLYVVILIYLCARMASRCSRAGKAWAFSCIGFFLVIALFYWQVRTYYFVVLMLLVGESYFKRQS